MSLLDDLLFGEGGFDAMALLEAAQEEQNRPNSFMRILKASVAIGYRLRPIVDVNSDGQFEYETDPETGYRVAPMFFPITQENRKTVMADVEKAAGERGWMVVNGRKNANPDIVVRLQRNMATLMGTAYTFENPLFDELYAISSWPLSASAIHQLVSRAKSLGGFYQHVLDSLLKHANLDEETLLSAYPEDSDERLYTPWRSFYGSYSMEVAAKAGVLGKEVWCAIREVPDLSFVSQDPLTHTDNNCRMSDKDGNYYARRYPVIEVVFANEAERDQYIADNGVDVSVKESPAGTNEDDSAPDGWDSVSMGNWSETVTTVKDEILANVKGKPGTPLYTRTYNSLVSKTVASFAAAYTELGMDAKTFVDAMTNAVAL